MRLIQFSLKTILIMFLLFWLWDQLLPWLHMSVLQAFLIYFGLLVLVSYIKARWQRFRAGL